jgi:hypothetical protein
MRAVVVWVVLAVFFAALGGGHDSADVTRGAAALMGGLFAAVTATGCGTSRALSALRRGDVVVDATAPRWRPWLRLLPFVVVALVLGALVAQRVAMHRPRPFAVLLVGAVTGVVIASLARVPKKAAPSSTTRAPWLLSGALVAGVVAGVVGGVVGVARFRGVEVVAPGVLARLLAGTSLSYALLGMGGFQKAFSEHKAGVVVVQGAPVQGTPGPFFAGLVTAAFCAVVGPWVLPSLSGAAVVVGKAAFGAVTGFSLSLLGALAGHRVAVWGRGGAPPSTSSETASSSTSGAAP